MTDNERIAERIQNIIDTYDSSDSDLIEELCELRNELRSLRPEPDTVVWWSEVSKSGAVTEWRLGQVQKDGLVYGFGSDRAKAWTDIEWKPARIPETDEVVIKKSLAENAWAALVETNSYGSAQEMQRAMGQQEPKDFFVPAPEHRADPIPKPRR